MYIEIKISYNSNYNKRKRKKGYIMEHDNRVNEYVVTKKTGKWPSKSTSGQCITVIARNMNSGTSYVVWPDTTFQNFPAWDKLTLGDIFDGVAIYNADKKRLNSRNTPRVTGHIVNISEKQVQMFEEADVSKNKA